MKLLTGLSLLLSLLTAFAENDSPAHQAAKHFMHGANCANFLEVPPDQNWAVPHTADDLKEMCHEGFDHVRLPVGWHHYAGPGPEFKLSDEIFGKVDNMVTNATALGLNIIINIHHFNEFTSDPAANTQEFYNIWRQIAAHYANAPAGVAFELLNEPKDAAKTTVINPIYAETIRQIRQTNPRRVIFVGPGMWNSANELKDLQLPEADRNIIVTVHCYDPFPFTHQGASWAGNDRRVAGIKFPGPPDKPLVPDPGLGLSEKTLDWIDRYNTLPVDENPCGPKAFRAMIDKARAWSEKNGRPIHVGEFGAYTKADQDSRARFYAAFRQALDEAGMGWAVWDWKSGFNYWDEKAKQPLHGMREALFPKKQASASPN